MGDGITNFFVYGSLKPGHWNHVRIERWVRNVQPGWTQGMLLDLGMIPAMVPGRGIVEGVVLALDTAALHSTDALEGHRPDPDHCWYHRRPAKIDFGNGQTCEAWLYEHAHPESLADRPRLLVGKRDGIEVYRWDGDRLVLDCGDLTVSCRLGLRVQSAESLLTQLRRACRAWSHAGSTLTIRHLRARLADADLRCTLSRHGIEDLRIEPACLPGLATFAQVLDEVLIRQGDLR